jgi:hypothetical protein
MLATTPHAALLHGALARLHHGVPHSAGLREPREQAHADHGETELHEAALDALPPSFALERGVPDGLAKLASGLGCLFGGGLDPIHNCRVHDSPLLNLAPQSWFAAF